MVRVREGVTVTAGIAAQRIGRRRQPKLDHGAGARVRTHADEANERHPWTEEGPSRSALEALESLCVLVCVGLRRLGKWLPGERHRRSERDEFDEHVGGQRRRYDYDCDHDHHYRSERWTEHAGDLGGRKRIERAE